MVMDDQPQHQMVDAGATVALTETPASPCHSHVYQYDRAYDVMICACGLVRPEVD